MGAGWSKRAGRLACALALLAGALVTVGAGSALALLSGVTSASDPIATEALTAPTSLTATGTPTIALSWTASTSPKFTGTRVFRGTTSGGPYAQIAQLASVATTSYSDSPGSGTFYYVVEAYYSGSGANWTSPMSNQASAQVPYLAHVVDGTGTQTTAAFSTAAAAEVVAFVGSDGPTGSSQTVTVSGAGLTWSLARRTNTQLGTAEVWAAHASAPLTNVTVKSTPAFGGFNQSLTVVAFEGLVAMGTSASANAATGAQSVSLTTTHPESIVYGVANDWDQAIARTIGPGQTMLHQWVETATGDTMWVQSRTAAVPSAGTNVTLNDTAPTTDRWNYAEVEIRAS